VIDAEKLLAELIALPSVNPAFLPAADSRAGEARVADFLASVAAKNGLTVEFQEVFPGRRNLLARVSPRGKVQQRIVLAPHMDTVGSAAMPDSHFSPVLKNERLFGRGACDTKGSIAAMFSALVNFAANGAPPEHTEIVFAGLVDEENAQEGSRALAASGFRADLAIVGEPTELHVITAHKGDMWLKLVTHGKAAHGARPELGVNAVHEMARVIDLLETRYARELKRRKHPVLGHPTINVGSVRGGTQPNIVPDCCEIEIDRRTIPGEKEAAVQREIVKFVREAGLKAEIINAKHNSCLPMETSVKLPLVRRFMEAAGQTKPEGVNFFCDAAILSAAGIPCVVFGPGNIAQAHTADEWISLASLRGAAELLESFFRTL
jgi:acetylornithine deacetylase/succinyl-diaminopimelate desuccinylase family protein